MIDVVLDSHKTSIRSDSIAGLASVRVTLAKGGSLSTIGSSPSTFALFYRVYTRWYLGGVVEKVICRKSHVESPRSIIMNLQQRRVTG